MSIASLYPSINPSLLLDFANSKVLDSRVTFTRTTTATYYDGVTTAKAEENLLTYSQEFDNAVYSKTNVTVTANSVAAPDGTTTADTVTQSAGTNFKLIDQAITGSAGQSYAVSVYAKAGTNNYIQLLFGGSNTDFANFDLSGAGAVGTVSGFTSGTTATITSVGNSWFRCVVSWSSLGTAFTSVNVCLIPSSTSARAATTANTNTVYLWGMQMEQRSSATAYTATTTQAITNYIPVLQTAAAGQARFDHNPTTGESLGLLIEEARTNSFTYSSDFSDATWTKTNATITANTIVAPDGTLTGDKLVETTTANSAHQVYKGTTLTAAPYTFSFYAKAAERTWCVVYFDSGFSAAYINLANGTVGSNPSGYAITVTSVGNGWYRIAATRTATAATWYTAIELATADNVRTYTGDGFSGIFIWGAQLEAGSFATSYIPTVASSVTRNADAASMTGTNFSSWFNNGEGTLYAEASTSAANTAKRFAQIDSGAESNRIQIAAEASGTTKNFAVVTNSSTQAYTPVSASYPVKVGAGYKVNDFGASFNGGAIQTDTSGTVPALSVMRFGAASDASENMNGCLRKVSYYPAKATSAQIVGLTT